MAVYDAADYRAKKAQQKSGGPKSRALDPRAHGSMSFNPPHSKAKTVSVKNNGTGSTKQGSAGRNRYMGATNMGKSLGRSKQRRDSRGRFA